MFLEQQLDQLTQRVTMHDQQIDILSKGLADLTTDVRAIRHDQIEGFKHMREYVDARFDQVDQRFDQLEGRFDQLEGRFDQLEGRFDQLEGRFDQLEERFDRLEGRFGQFEGRFDRLEGRFGQFEQTQSLIVKLLTDRV